MPASSRVGRETRAAPAGCQTQRAWRPCLKRRAARCAAPLTRTTSSTSRRSSLAVSSEPQAGGPRRETTSTYVGGDHAHAAGRRDLLDVPGALCGRVPSRSACALPRQRSDCERADDLQSDLGQRVVSSGEREQFVAAGLEAWQALVADWRKPELPTPGEIVAAVIEVLEEAIRADERDRVTTWGYDCPNCKLGRHSREQMSREHRLASRAGGGYACTCGFYFRTIETWHQHLVQA